MTDEQLAEIEARAKAATRSVVDALETMRHGFYTELEHGAATDALAALNAARSDVPALVADNRRLEAEVRRLRDALRSLMDTWGKSEHDFTDEQSAAQQAAYDALWPNGRPVAEILDDTPDPPDAAKVAKRLARSEAIKAGIDADAMNDAVGVKKPGDGE